MSKTTEMLDKISELRRIHPQAEVMFFVNTEEGCDFTYTHQEISSVVLEEIANYTEQTLIGEDEILEYLGEQIYDEELEKVNGDRESVPSNEEMDDLAKCRLDEHRKNGTVRDVILIKTDA